MTPPVATISSRTITTVTNRSAQRLFQRQQKSLSNSNSQSSPSLTVLPYRVHVHSSHCKDQIVRIVSELFFKDTKDRSDVQIRPLLGGLSNTLFVVSSPVAKPVLVRVHPDASPEDDLVDREAETRLQHWLVCHQQSSRCCTTNSSTTPSSSALAPRVYGTFSNGRVEEFYPHHQALTSCRDMITYGPAIAQALAQLHALPLPPTAVFADSQSWQERERQWLRLGASCLEKASSSDDDNDDSQQAQQLWNTCQHAWNWTTEAFQHHNTVHNNTAEQQWAAHKVLAHGDCQSLNVMVSSADKNDNNKNDNNHQQQVRLIDYEYALVAPRALDLANTFCEYCDMNNLRANYEQEYPTLEQQVQFLRAYLDNDNNNDNSSSSSSNDDDCLDMQQLSLEIGKYTIVSHLQWAIWSIVRHFQSHHQNEDHTSSDDDDDNNNNKPTEEEETTFDYLAYAQQRLDGYEHHKKQFWDGGN